MSGYLKERKIIEDTIKYFGVHHQLKKVMEELEELKVEVRTYHDGAENKKELIDEIVDVSIVIDQLMEIVGIDGNDLFKRRNYKMERLKGITNKKRLEKESD